VKPDPIAALGFAKKRGLETMPTEEWMEMLGHPQTADRDFPLPDRKKTRRRSLKFPCPAGSSSLHLCAL